ncbi:MAG: DUF2892 domain-containing protein [Gemmatimonadales bacterium]|nr:DUF2892 domain-containing protein [Gemmatimonadales bacterium]
MSRNVGGWDRALRILLGIGILGLYGALEPPGQYFTLLGLIPLGTGLLGQCPIYSAMGVSTVRSGKGTS